MRDFRVSVSMVTYNQGPYVVEAIESVLNQKTDFDFEIIIGDDASTDGTQEILKRLAAKSPRIQLQLRSSNLGANENFNRVFNSCTGKYIATLDGDDFWIDERKLQKQVDFLEQHLECAVVGAYTRIERTGSPPDTLPQEEQIAFFQTRLGTAEDFLKCHFIHTSAVLYRNVLKGKLPSYGNLGYGDRCLTSLHAQHGKIGFLHETLSVYRQVSTGICHGITEIERAYFNVEFYERVKEFLDKALLPTINEQLVNHRIKLLHLLEKENQIHEARLQLLALWKGDRESLRWGDFLKLNFRTLFPTVFSLSKTLKHLFSTVEARPKSSSIQHK